MEESYRPTRRHIPGAKAPALDLVSDAGTEVPAYLRDLFFSGPPGLKPYVSGLQPSCLCGLPTSACGTGWYMSGLQPLRLCKESTEGQRQSF